MRDWLVAHSHSLTGFVLLMLMAATFAGTMEYEGGAGPTLSAIPAPPMPLPLPENDADQDSFGDDVDLVDGDAMIRITIQGLNVEGILPYFMVGTQDDQWRFGAGKELEWPHVIDPDPLGHRPGSKGWYDEVVRTGAWWLSIPMDGEAKALARTGDLSVPAAGVTWPQTFMVNVRDDQAIVNTTIQLYDARGSPDRRVGEWVVQTDLINGTHRVGSGEFLDGTPIELVEGGIGFMVERTTGLAPEIQQQVAARWAPNLYFDSEEQFFPIKGDAMAQFHGFSRTPENQRDLRTWEPSFNNARDSYVLLLADFNGDRRVDHKDAAVMTGVLRGGGLGDTVYAQVAPTTGGILVQYWFVYSFNFVEDEQGGPVQNLAHRGDREFITLFFDSLTEAQAGAPAWIAYSQHYGGIRIDEPDLGAVPFNGTHPDVFPARGSHASFPMAGDDRRSRPALAGHFDRFDGLGESWTAEDYRLEILAGQPWAFGHLWGPTTRSSRDFGTTGKPLLKHDFTYPYIDPISWANDLTRVHQDVLDELYGGGA